MTNPAQYSGHTITVSSAESQRVLRNTYGLLAMSLAVSTGAAWFAMAANIGFINPFVVIGVYFALLFVNAKLENSAWGVLSVFGITGWLGFTTGPIINAYAAMGAGELVTLALGMTAAIFVAMSAIGLMVKKDLSGMGKFIMAGLLVAFIAGIVGYFTKIPALQIVVSSMFALLSSMLIMWQTNQIVNGGEDNYIRATVTLFISLYNLFLSLLHLLTVLAGDD